MSGVLAIVRMTVPVVVSTVFTIDVNMIDVLTFEPLAILDDQRNMAKDIAATSNVHGMFASGIRADGGAHECGCETERCTVEER